MRQGSPSSIRPMRAGDVPILADLWVRSWRETLPAIDFEARRPWIAGFLDGAGSERRVTIVAVDPDERPIGFATLEPSLSHLHQLAVAPSAKGRGVAAMLLDAAKAASPRGLVLDVNQDNPRAVRFYEREGFRQEAEGINPDSGLRTWRLRWSPA